MTAKNQLPKTSARKPQRFATRVSGGQWKADIAGISGTVRVLEVSRTGIKLETQSALEVGDRYRIHLTHRGETTKTTFYVLRCPHHGTGAERVYHPAGLFVETINRDDLPNVIPDAP